MRIDCVFSLQVCVKVFEDIKAVFHNNLWLLIIVNNKNIDYINLKFYILKRDSNYNNSPLAVWSLKWRHIISSVSTCNKKHGIYTEGKRRKSWYLNQSKPEAPIIR